MKNSFITIVLLLILQQNHALVTRCCPRGLAFSRTTATTTTVDSTMPIGGISCSSALPSYFSSSCRSFSSSSSSYSIKFCYNYNHKMMSKTSKPRLFSTLLQMGSYLDSLSSSTPSQDGNEDENHSSSSNDRKNPPSFAWNGGTMYKKELPNQGIIPSGRGPLGSYLDAISKNTSSSSGSSSSYENSNSIADNDKDNHSDIEEGEEEYQNKNKPSSSSWSQFYLTKFQRQSLGSGEQDNDPRTDIRNLLTQRSIQSFMRLLEECRDPHSAKWIQQDFLQTGNLLDYHGTGAQFVQQFGGTWDAPLLSMMQKPRQQMIISAKRRGRGHGGWSKNNPYLEERWVEIPVDIDPCNLVTRILSVREQIAKEWAEKDLDALMYANDQILDSFFEETRKKRLWDQERKDNNKVVGESGDNDGSGGGGGAFVRMADNLINDNSRFATQVSSPFRRSNFDLLYNLCTQAAIHRLLRQKMHATTGKEADDASFVFLKDFYTGRVDEYFDGDLPFGRADDFLEDLLETSPFVLSSGATAGTVGGTGKNVGLVDPVGTAEEIIQMRRVVAQEWKVWMQRVPDDHMVIRQALLSNQMKRMQQQQQQQQQKSQSTEGDGYPQEGSYMDGFQ